MNRILCAIIALRMLVPASSTPAKPMPIQPVTVSLWDVSPTNQIRGAARFMGLPRGGQVQVSLRVVAGPGPDAALIGTGTCAGYKRLYTLKSVRNGLSNTTLPSADIVKLFKTPHVVALPGLKYCGPLKTIFLP